MDQYSKRIIRIAVTGHRFIPANPILSTAVHRVLTGIVTCHSAANFLLYSALAEGSDQLVAKIALKYRKIKLIVPLPLPIEQYLADFETTAGKKAFYEIMKLATETVALPTQPDSHSAYQSLGNYLITQCDQLIAIWNGKFNLKKGGTSEVVKLALASGKPVHWIYCENQDEDTVDDLQNHKKIGEIQTL